MIMTLSSYHHSAWEKSPKQFWLLITIMSNHPKLHVTKIISESPESSSPFLQNHHHQNPHLVKGNNVDAATEVDVLRVQTIYSFLLESLLGKGIVRSQS